MSEFQEGTMNGFIACDLINLDDRRRTRPRNLAEELAFLDAYGRPIPGGTLEALTYDSEDVLEMDDPGDSRQCEVIYWQFHTAASR